MVLSQNLGLFGFKFSIQFLVFRYFMIFFSPSQNMGPEGLEVMQFSKPRGCFKGGCLSTSGKNCDRIWIAMPAWIFYAISFFPTSGKLGTPSSSCSFLIQLCGLQKVDICLYPLQIYLSTCMNLFVVIPQTVLSPGP